ncbi:unnamed protein product, partial [Meganyctiphanes norvegica]
MTQEPNGNIYENCAKIEPKGIADVECTNTPCAMCELKGVKIFSFLGACETEVRNVHFTVYQKAIAELLFRSYGKYHIRKDASGWKWVNVVENITLASLDSKAQHDMPMGRRLWKLDSPVCDQIEGENRMLLLTKCNSSQYTCDDGTCIPHSSLCDLKFDCLDESDESASEKVRPASKYLKDLPPRNSGEGSLPVILNIQIESVNIDTVEMTMETSWELSQIWYDIRLKFQNLKISDSLNLQTFTEIKKLWTPTVGFVNTKNYEHTLVDEETRMLIMKRTPFITRDSSVAAEVEIYSGTSNPMIISRKYSSNFICDFDLTYYPFDEQRCDMRLKMNSASVNFITFDPVNSTVVYLGTTQLVEYQIGAPYLIFDNNNEYSEVRVRIPLIRLSGYAILNIYTPSTILLLICYITLFFRTDIFEVRVMTALTTLLVMATLFAQVSASLPKTSYFKMVDIWLLFCIIISFFIIIFHALIDKGVNHKERLTLTKFSPINKATSKKIIKTAEEVLEGISMIIFAR